MYTRLSVEDFNREFCSFIDSKFGCLAVHLKDDIWSILCVFDKGISSASFKPLFTKGPPDPKQLPFSHTECEMKQIIKEEYSFISTVDINDNAKFILDSHAVRFYYDKQKTISELKHETFVNLLNNSIRNSINIIMNSITETSPTIKNACVKLTNEIFDLIDYSNMESGKIKLKNTVICLKEFLQKIVSGLSRKIEFHYENLPDYVIADIPRLRQMLLHLLNNAIQYSEADKEILFYVSAQSFRDEVTLDFVIKDNGIGLHESTAVSIFYPIELKKTTSISMRMCFLLAKAMNGNLSLADNSRGQGASFNLKITVREDQLENVDTLKKYKNKQILIVGDNISNGLRQVLDKYNFLHIKFDRIQNIVKYRPDLVVWADNHPPNETALVIPQDANFEYCKRKILDRMRLTENKIQEVLIIDNDTENVQILKEMLDKMHVKCSSANNRTYKEALERSSAEIIIVGTKMPIVSGLTLANYIKSINSTAKIIGLYDNDDDYEIFDGVLCKPIDFDELHDLIS